MTDWKTEMSHTISMDVRSAASGSVEGLFARIRKSIADYRLYLATLGELESLSDRDLADLGIHRSSIREIARASVWN
jgi:uncharacterized protein YjiS (DUF1127 family)